jgi:hypothetical protein
MRTHTLSLSCVPSHTDTHRDQPTTLWWHFVPTLSTHTHTHTHMRTHTRTHSFEYPHTHRDQRTTLCWHFAPILKSCILSCAAPFLVPPPLFPSSPSRPSLTLALKVDPLSLNSNILSCDGTASNPHPLQDRQTHTHTRKRTRRERGTSTRTLLISRSQSTTHILTHHIHSPKHTRELPFSLFLSIPPSLFLSLSPLPSPSPSLSLSLAHRREGHQHGHD